MVWRRALYAPDLVYLQKFYAMDAEHLSKKRQTTKKMDDQWISLNEAIAAVAALVYDKSVESTYDKEMAWNKALADAKYVLSNVKRLDDDGSF